MRADGTVDDEEVKVWVGVDEMSAVLLLSAVYSGVLW